MTGKPTGETSSLEPAFEMYREPLWWRLALIMLVSAAFLFRFVQTQDDPDLWGHVRFGLDALRSGTITRTDPYSYITAGGPWINHEVLAELAMGLAYSFLGPMGLNLLRLAVGSATLVVIWWTLRRRGVTTMITAAMTSLAIVLMAMHLIEMRPHIFTLLFFTLTVIILGEAEQRGRKMLWLLVPIFWVWINTHGGVLAGLGISGIWALVRLFQIGSRRSVPGHTRLREGAQLIAPLLAGLAATLITPYGPGLLHFLLRTATGPRPEIVDWQPLPLVSAVGAAYLIGLAITLPALLFSRRPRSIPLVCIYAVMALAPFLAVRHLPLFGSAAVLIAGEHVNDLWVRWRGIYRTSPGSSSRLFQYVVIGSSAGFLIASAIVSIGKLPYIPVRKDFYPTHAVQLIREHVQQGNLAVHFNWGEYAIWHLGPAVKVSLDGRRETVYNDQLYQMCIRFMFGEGEWDTLLDRYPTDMALVGRQSPTYNLLRWKPGWVLVYEDEISALFVREDFPYRRPLEAAAAQAGDGGDVDLRFP